MFKNCLIMAGGSGTRLWPASNSRRPKQFLPVSKDKDETFFSQSIKRAFKVIEKNSGKVIVIAGKSHLSFIIETCSNLIPEEKMNLILIPEPQAKNSAPAIACAVTYLNKTDNGNNNMLVLTSDHIIKPEENFIADTKIAMDFAMKDRLVVFGIMPSRPKTGYGYIKAGNELTKGVQTVDAFIEKPNRDTAEKLTASERFFWNSGMFAFNCNFITEEFRQHDAGVIGPFEKLHPPENKSYTSLKGIKVLKDWSGLERAYNQTENISFDKAIAEKCSCSVMVKASFDWIDVGDWDEYSRLLSNSTIDSHFPGTEVYTDGSCERCFVDSDVSVALAGVEDLIVVIRSGRDGSAPAALIVRKGETQRVKDIVEQIRKSGRTELL